MFTVKSGKKPVIIFYAAALSTVLIWSSAYVGIRYAVNDFSPQALATLRFSIASLFLIPAAMIKRIQIPSIKDIPWFLLVGFTGFFLYNIMLNAGEIILTASISSFIIGTSPIISSFLGMIFLKEKISLKNWLGLTVSLAGIMMISLSDNNTGKINYGVVLILGASLLISIYNILQRYLVRKYSPLSITIYGIWSGTVFLCLFVPDLIREIGSAPAVSVAIIAYLGIFPAAIGYLLWSYVLSAAPTTSQAAAFMYITPFLAILQEWLFLHENIQLLAVCGGMIIVLGVIITNRKKSTVISE